MARPTNAVLAARAKSKALLAQEWKSDVPGVSFIASGEPRWVVRIRWRHEGVNNSYRLRVWKLKIDPKTGTYTAADLRHWKRQAEAWAEAEWLALDKSGREYSRSSQASAWTLRTLLERYLEGLDDGSIKYRSCVSDRSRIRVLLGIAEKGANAGNTAFGWVLDKPMDTLRPTDFYTETPKTHPHALLLHYKGRNGGPAKNNAAIKLIQTIRTVMGHAIREWGLDLDLSKVPMPPITKDPGREEVLTEEEYGWIIEEMAECDPATRDVVLMTRYSAMRRSEAVKLNWEDVSADFMSAKLNNTKSRRVKGKDIVKSRVVPLAPPIAEMLARRRKDSPTGQGPIFTTKAGKRIWADAITKAWDRARKRAAKKHNAPELLNKRLHDLRHTRITELGADVPVAMIAKMSGHDDLASFMRYFNPRAEHILEKMILADQRRMAKKGITTSEDKIEMAVQVMSQLSQEEMALVMGKLLGMRAAT